LNSVFAKYGYRLIKKIRKKRKIDIQVFFQSRNFTKRNRILERIRRYKSKKEFQRHIMKY